MWSRQPPLHDHTPCALHTLPKCWRFFLVERTQVNNDNSRFGLHSNPRLFSACYFAEHHIPSGKTTSTCNNHFLFVCLFHRYPRSYATCYSSGYQCIMYNSAAFSYLQISAEIPHHKSSVTLETPKFENETLLNFPAWKVSRAFRITNRYLWKIERLMTSPKRTSSSSFCIRARFLRNSLTNLSSAFMISIWNIF